MKHRTRIATLVMTGTFAALAVIPVRAGGDKIAFPADYAKGVMYTTVDRADNKQYRELYISPAAAIDAAKKGEALPSGTVITLVQYAAKLDASGNPEKDTNGRFIKTNIIAYTVMEKRAGWARTIPTTSATANGSIRRSRPTRLRTPPPTSRPASPATSRSIRSRTSSSALKS